MNLNAGLEKPRFQLLIEACNSEDAFYVALHQVFCVWDFDQNEVASIQGFPDGNILRQAFKILGQLIRDNEHIGAIPTCDGRSWHISTEACCGMDPFINGVHEKRISASC